MAPPAPVRSLGLELVLRVDAAQFCELRTTLVGLSRPRPGCIERGAFRAVEDPLKLRWSERWWGEREFRQYLDSESFRALLGAAEVLAHVEDLRFIEEQPSAHFPSRPPLDAHGRDRE